MEMRTMRAVCALGAVLSLGSCQVLNVIFGSVFPATTVLAKAQANLSGQITSNDGSAFHVRVLETGGYGYVLVIGNPSSGSVAFIYDLDLNFKQTLILSQGDGAMVDALGRIVVGNIVLNPDLTPNSTLPTLPAGTFLFSNNEAGVDGFVDTALTEQIAGFSISSGNTLNYTTYPNTWASGSPSIVTLSSSMSNLQVFGVFDDSAAGKAVFIVGQSNNGGSNNATTYFFAAPKATSFVVTTNVLDLSPPSRSNLDTGTFGYAQGTIIAYDNGSGNFVRIDPTTGSTQASFYSGTDPSNTRFAYRAGGGSFYGFDTKARVLTKYSTWW